MRLGVQGVQAEFWWWRKFVILQWNSVYLCFLVDYNSLYLFRPLYLMYLLLQHCICYLQKRVLIHTPNTVIWKWHYISRKVPKGKVWKFVYCTDFYVKLVTWYMPKTNLQTILKGVNLDFVEILHTTELWNYKNQNSLPLKWSN